MSESRFDPVWPRSVAFALVGAVLLPLYAAFVPAAASPADVTGIAIVIDGDTLEIDGWRVRLEGIDAPESAQACGRPDGGTWACGRAAADGLGELVGRRPVTCRANGVDSYGRMLGACTLDGRDLNAEMVRRGLAWAFVKYSASYVSEEAEARSGRAGIWQGEAEPAWIFRENRWKSAGTVAPDGCAIKGNITGNGRIYHMPWSPWYGRVKVDAERGERWFCSEAEARDAGWRAAAAR